MPDNNIDYNIEDTGTLLTASRGSGRRKLIILIVIVAIAVAAIAVVVIRMTGEKKYNDQLATAEKALREGQYEQAEADYLAAVNMKKRDTKAREGLAFTYAIEGKFEQAQQTYQELFDMTKEESYSAAAKSAGEGQLPELDEIIPIKNLWIEKPAEALPDPEDLQQFMDIYLAWSGYEGYQAETRSGAKNNGWNFNNEEPENSYALPVATILIDEERYPQHAAGVETEVNINHWGTEFTASRRVSKDVLDQVYSEMFNVDPDKIPDVLASAESSKLMYLEGDKYIMCIIPMGLDWITIRPSRSWVNGSRYCIEYEAFENSYDGMQQNSLGTFYAVMGRKDIGGTLHWTMYYNGADMPSEVKDGMVKVAAPEGSIDNAAVYSSYAEVLRANESVIKAYGWQMDNTGEYYNEYDYEAGRYIGDIVNPCIALHDLNGDNVPELLFWGSTENFQGKLHIYTYSGGKAVECDYSVTNYGPEGGLFTDVHVAAGTDYMIYTGKEKGVFYIAYGMGDELYTDAICEITMDTGGRITQKNCIQYTTGPNEDYSGTMEEYTLNGTEVSSDKGRAEINRMLQAYNTLLISSYRHDEYAEFNSIGNERAEAMSYDEAIKKLSGQ